MCVCVWAESWEWKCGHHFRIAAEPCHNYQTKKKNDLFVFVYRTHTSICLAICIALLFDLFYYLFVCDCGFCLAYPHVLIESLYIWSYASWTHTHTEQNVHDTVQYAYKAYTAHMSAYTVSGPRTQCAVNHQKIAFKVPSFWFFCYFFMLFFYLLLNK